MTSILDHGQANTATASVRASVIRSLPSGAALGTGRRSGGALVAVLQPADLGDGHETPALRRLDVPGLGTVATGALMRARRVVVPVLRQNHVQLLWWQFALLRQAQYTMTPSGGWACHGKRDLSVGRVAAGGDDSAGGASAGAVAGRGIRPPAERIDDAAHRLRESA